MSELQSKVCWSAGLQLHVIVLTQPSKIFDVLNVMVTVLLAAIPCSLLDVYHCFWETLCLYAQHRWWFTMLVEAAGCYKTLVLMSHAIFYCIPEKCTCKTLYFWYFLQHTWCYAKTSSLLHVV